MAVKNYAPGEPLELTADFVIRTVKAVLKADRETEFLKMCEDGGVKLRIDRDAADLVRIFLDERARPSLDARVRSAVDGERCEC